MANVTVLGANYSDMVSQVTIDFGTSSTLNLAEKLASQISAAITNFVAGPAWQEQANDFAFYAPSGGEIGVENIGATDGSTPSAGPSAVSVYAGYSGFIDNASNATTVTGRGDAFAPVSVLGGGNGLTYNSGLNYDGLIGSGTIVAASGTNAVNIAASTLATGGYLIGLGDGANTIAAASGSNTIYGGSGTNLINVGNTLAGGAGSSNLIGLMGNDTITATAGSGHDTVGVNGLNDSVLINFASGFTGTLYFGNTSTSFANAGADTVLGGGGAVTLFGGLAQTDFVGGTAGHNLIVAGEDHGAAKSSVTGAGIGDMLYASSIGGGVITAGFGNQTLVGAGHNGLTTGVTNINPAAASVSGTVFNADSAGGGASIYVGTGADTVNVGSGHDFVDGNVGVGGTLYNFNQGITSIGGATTTEMKDFTVGADTVALTGYGETLAQVAAASSIVNGNTVVQLNDGTTITFDGVTTLFSDPGAKFIIG